MDTSRPRYGRCTECDEIKHLDADGVLLDHNAYRVDGTAVAVERCPGSGCRPRDAAADHVTPGG